MTYTVKYSIFQVRDILLELQVTITLSVLSESIATTSTLKEVFSSNNVFVSLSPTMAVVPPIFLMTQEA